jgi:DNA processing protein
MSRACSGCLRRGWLLAALSGHLDRVRAEICELLELDDGELIRAVGGRRRRELERQVRRWHPDLAGSEAPADDLQAICRCDPGYPVRLRRLRSPPTVLHVAGRLDCLLGAGSTESVALVGSRRASAYGTEIAHALARQLAVAGVPVISGMAMGVDSAAHRGALSVGGPTLAVLPGPAGHAHPRANRPLHRQLTQVGAAVSELPAGTPVRSWMYTARNRLIAGLASMTVVVEAGMRSGALLTAAVARDLGRPVGAVPGRVTAVQAAGPIRLIREGAQVVSDAQDVLDVLFEAGSRKVPAGARPELSPELAALLEAIGEGRDTPGALSRDGLLPEQGLAALAELELGGYIRREPGGRFAVVPPGGRFAVVPPGGLAAAP